MALFKFGGLKIIRQTANLNTPPNILHIQYSLHMCTIGPYPQLRQNKNGAKIVGSFTQSLYGGSCILRC